MTRPPSASGTPRLPFALALLFAGALSLRAGEAKLGLYDTGTSSAQPLSAEAASKQEGWTKVPLEEKAHDFKGDAVLFNPHLLVVLRRGSDGAELYAKGPEGFKLRGRLIPLAQTPLKQNGLKIVTLEAGNLAVEVLYEGGAVFACALEPANPILKTAARTGVSGLRVEAPSRFGILPDFFADDILLDAQKLPLERTEAPSENFFLLPQAGGEALVTAIWDKNERDVTMVLAGKDAERQIAGVEIQYGKDGSIWMAVLEGKNICHLAEATPENAGKEVALPWGPPFQAKWKANLPKANGTNDSWEMLWHPANRSQWATAIGRYIYPVWIDGKEGAWVGHFQLPGAKKPEDACKGPLVIYPIDRTDKTPLERYTLMDLMRNSLGQGPCEYIMDLAGQGSGSKGLYTCAVYDMLMPVFLLGRNREDRAYVEKTFNDGLAFVMAIRGRIEAFVKWGQDLRAWLAEQKKANPELAPFAEKMETLAKVLDTRYAAKKGAATADVAKWIADFKPILATEAGCKKGEQLCQAIRDGVGGPQDDLVAECRIAVKQIRQAAALEMALDPKTAPLAREIRKRTHEILRNKYGHEGR